MTKQNLSDIGRLPVHSDNCAIATKTIAAGTQISHEGHVFALSHTVLVGHRFAIEPIDAGEHLLSWGLPFGSALCAIKPGEYVSNALVIEELAHHRLPFEIPESANFTDDIPPFVFNETEFQPADPLPRHTQARTFQGYKRAGGRGVGTRNTIVLLGVNGTVSGFTRQLKKRLDQLAESFQNIDEISAVVHTEGIKADSNNGELLLRTLAGFIVHPNVAAVLIIDNGVNGLTNDILTRYMLKNDYPLDSVTHHFLSINGPFTAKLDEASAVVEGWLPKFNKMQRTPQSISELKIALQCGGSDAFSGISGNPLISWVSKELIQYGGSANLAETDELVGAESYVLSRCRDSATAERFLATIDRFKKWAERHGHSAEGNPSGGNRYRGLYNIYLKSLGAATKRHPDVPLDFVIDYSGLMTEPGYYFMDSPGNDLESIAGQVAAGCNLIFFVTGNGSITNFPFVPTLKVVTTSDRYALLSADMDIDAGEYLTGKPLDLLGQETFEHCLETASGRLSVGEKAGHSQVQIWRNWSLVAENKPDDLIENQNFRRLPITTRSNDNGSEAADWVQQPPQHKLNLILPTSLCSGQIAKMVVEKLNQNLELVPFTTLVHTEGCGSSTQTEYINTMLGYMNHPLVENCLLLEHGCEKTHNSYWRTQMDGAGLPLDQFGWASIQQDGGIDKAMVNIADWFEQQADTGHLGENPPLCLGLTTTGLLAQNEQICQVLATLAGRIIVAGGTVIVPKDDQLWQSKWFLEALEINGELEPTIAFAGKPIMPGLHMMAGQPSGWTELLTGLGAAGCDLFLSVSDGGGWLQNGHPMVPLIQVGLDEDIGIDRQWDLVLTSASQSWLSDIVSLLKATRNMEYRPLTVQQNNVDFQITRGAFGISL